MKLRAKIHTWVDVHPPRVLTAAAVGPEFGGEVIQYVGIRASLSVPVAEFFRLADLYSLKRL